MKTYSSPQLLFSRLLKTGNSIDFAFLFFLIGVTSVKLSFKLAVAVVYFILLFFQKKIKFQLYAPVKFYCAIGILGIASSLINSSFNDHNYWKVCAYGTSIWILGGLTFLLLKNSIDADAKAKMKNTVGAFFVLNAIFCAVQIAMMFIRCNGHFPYWYNDPTGAFGTSAGDHLHGIFINNTAVVNASINLLAFLYFLFIDWKKLSLTCLIVSLCCLGNLLILQLCILMTILFIFFKKYRAYSLLCFALITASITMLSPSNFDYMKRMVGRFWVETKIKEIKKTEVLAEKAETIEEKIEQKNIVKNEEKSVQSAEKKEEKTEVSKQLTDPYEYFNEPQVLKDINELKEVTKKTQLLSPNVPFDTTFLQQLISQWYRVPYCSTALKQSSNFGKLYSFAQTVEFLKSNKKALLFGAGIGNFSSRTAWKFSGVGEGGEKVQYISENYFYNHFYTNIFYLAQPISEHSVANSTNSVYNQLSGEYGLIGVLLFAGLYFLYFLKISLNNRKKALLLLGLLMMFSFEYWFETVTLVVFFELFMLLEVDKTEPLRKKLVSLNAEKNESYSYN